jgi:hypothetical protein
MLCRHCSADVPDDSRYCPVCGKPLASSALMAAAWRTREQTASAPSASLLQVPVSSGARALRIGLLLVLDVAMAGVGGFLIASYLDQRSQPAAVPAPSESVERDVRGSQGQAPSDSDRLPTAAM